MGLPPYGPEPYASANSATPANWRLNKARRYVTSFPHSAQEGISYYLAPSCSTRKQASAERTAAHHSKTQKDPPKRVFRFRMVRARGLEPPWGCPHTDLNRTRLPIPPRPRIGALTRQEGMLRHFLILRKREFHIILHPLAARESKLRQSELQRIIPRRKKTRRSESFDFEWCGREDLNLHGVAPIRT